MKKLLLAISLVATLFFTSGCDIDINITVKAKADLIYPSLDMARTQEIPFGPFTHYNLSYSEIDSIFRTLIKGNNTDFTSAWLYLEYYDNISGAGLRAEEYGVVIDADGRYSYELMEY